MGQQRAIRYTLDVENPDGSAGVLRFKVLKARWMVAADPRVPKMIAARALRAWIEERPEAINAGHLEHIPALVREHPGLLVQFDEMAPDGSMRPTAVLIDGTHRAALALRDGRPFYAYLLSDAEMAAIVEVEGTEYASVPGTSPDLSETPIGRVIP